MIKISRLCSNLGYCSRSTAQVWLKRNNVSLQHPDGRQEKIKNVHHMVNPDQVLLDGKPLPYYPPVTILVNKPKGFICSTKRDSKSSNIVQDLLPKRMTQINPPLSFAGRLDSDVTGLLLMSQDGDFVHRIISPKRKKTMPKVYEVLLLDALSGNEADVFASGTIVLRNEKEPLRPALLEVVNKKTMKHVRVTLFEGRYHQISRMFAYLGKKVESIHRISIGPFQIPENLEEGTWQHAREDLYNLIVNDKYEW
jgi:16S rRNA pseudouridine516 synthase